MSLATVRSRRGLTLIEIVVVVVILGLLAAALVMLLGGGSGGSSGVTARNTYRSTVEASPPAYLSSSGDPARILIEVMTDTLTNGVVTYTGTTWAAASGLTVVFSVGPHQTAWIDAAGTASKTVTTGPDGRAAVTVLQGVTGSNTLTIKWSTPDGQSGTEPLFNFEVP